MISLFVAVANLWTFGKYLERVTIWPAASVLAMYVICGLVGAIASANLSMDGVSAGAPAAVCGLLGAPWLCAVLQHLRVGCPCSSCGRCSCGPLRTCAGASWADQALNWPLYRNQPATAVVLLGVTAQFVVLGLLPLLDTFFVGPAFLAGLVRIKSLRIPT